MSELSQKAKDSIIWSKKAQNYALTPPLNLAVDIQYPGVPFHDMVVEARTLILHEYRDVEVLWWNYGFYVLNADGIEICDLCFGVGEKPTIESLRSADAKFIEGVTASIMHWVPGNYSHILAEHLPLVQALSEAGQLGRVNHVLCDNWASGFLNEVLGLYASNAEVIGVPVTGHVRLSTLLAFEPLLHPAHWGHDVMGRFFDTIREAAEPAQPYRKLIVARPVGRRGFINLPQLVSVLPDFEVVKLESPTSLLSQACLFAEAKLVVCGHGAALNNLVFMRPGMGVVEIFNRDYGTPAFWLLAGMRRVRYCASIDARGIGTYRDHGKSEDIEVDVPQVLAAVRLLQAGEV